MEMITWQSTNRPLELVVCVLLLCNSKQSQIMVYNSSPTSSKGSLHACTHKPSSSFSTPTVPGIKDPAWQSSARKS